MSTKTKKPSKPYNGRDLLKVALIKGATKAGVQKDKKKEENKKRGRKKVEIEKE